MASFLKTLFRDEKIQFPQTANYDLKTLLIAIMLR